MGELKVGDLGYMKLTGEPAFILDIGGPPINEAAEVSKALGPWVAVRLTGGGPKTPPSYPTRDLRMAELETLEQRAKRDFEESTRVRKLVGLLTASAEKEEEKPARVN